MDIIAKNVKGLLYMSKEMFRKALTKALELTDTKEDWKRFKMHFDFALKNLDDEKLNIQTEEDIKKIYMLFAQMTNMLLTQFEVEEEKERIFNEVMNDVDMLFMQAFEEVNK